MHDGCGYYIRHLSKLELEIYRASLTLDFTVCSLINIKIKINKLKQYISNYTGAVMQCVM